MAWKWVSTLRNPLGQEIKCYVPSYSPETAGLNDSQYVVEANPYESDATYERDRFIVSDLLTQSVDPDFRSIFSAVGNEWHFPILGGEIMARVQRVITTDRLDMYFYAQTTSATLLSLNPTSYNTTAVSGVLASHVGIVFAYNEELQRLHMGVLCIQHYDSGARKTTYSANLYKSFTKNLWTLLEPYIPEPGAGGPYDDGGTSEPGTQEPTWDDSSDVIGVPAVPAFTLITNNILHAWAPSVSDLNTIGTYLWSNFDITDPTKTLSKVFQSPLESILTLHALPFAVSSGSAIRLTLAGFDTGVDLPPLTAQFIDVPCGSITIEPYWDNYLDYNPYTKITLCLPFAGQVTLDPDEVMGKTVSVTYRVDCLTGSFVCFVYIDGDKVLGQYAGNCALSIPISAADYGRFNAAILGVAASAASAFGAVASGGSALGALADVAGSAVQEIQDAKVRVAHSGGLTGAPGFMGVQKPYLIIHRARQSVPEGYGGFKGYPLNVTKTLGECSGFTSVREIHLDGIPLTEPELAELRGILEGGIII